MNLIDDIIYLDNAFIVESYQKIYKKDAAVRYTKTTDVSFGMNFVANAGASMKETFEYPITAHSMYQKLSKQLSKIELFELRDDNIKNLPEIFWMEGVFGITRMRKTEEGVKGSSTYSFGVTGEDNTQNLFLATNDNYFSTGYDQLLSNAAGFADQFSIKVKVLIKFLGTTNSVSIATPLVMIKTGNYNFDNN